MGGGTLSQGLEILLRALFSRGEDPTFQQFQRFHGVNKNHAGSQVKLSRIAFRCCATNSAVMCAGRAPGMTACDVSPHVEAVRRRLEEMRWLEHAITC